MYTTSPRPQAFRHPVYGDASPTGNINTTTEWAEFSVKNPHPSQSGNICLWFPLRVWNRPS